jgi:hypothetical protein
MFQLFVLTSVERVFDFVTIYWFQKKKFNLKIRKPLIPKKILRKNPNQRIIGSDYLKNLKEPSVLQNVSAIH